MINFAANLNKMIDAGLGGPLDPPRTEVAVGHRVIYSEVSGAVVNFETNVAAPVKNLRVTMRPIQDLHGYDQPWPAGGGKNLLNMLKDNYGGTSANVYYVDLTVNGNDINAITLIAGQTYTLSADVQCDNMPCKFSVGCGNGTYTQDIITKDVAANGRVSVTFTPTEEQLTNKPFLAIRPIRYSDQSSFTWSVSNIQLELGSTATEFAPYSNICPITGRDAVTVYRSGADMSNPQSVTVQLGQTVYGGTLDVTTGTMTVTHAIVDLGDTNWVVSAVNPTTPFRTQAVSSLPMFDGKIPKYNENFICTMYPSSGIKTFDTVPVGTIAFTNGQVDKPGNNMIRIVDPDCFGMTAAEFKAHISGVMLCYELEEPFTMQVAPAQLSTLAGENNVWSDAGNISLEYPYYEETEGY